MNLKPLFEAIVNTLAFLELSDDSVIDPDAAISMEDDLATTLQTLDAEVLSEFITFVRETAERERILAVDMSRVEFIESLPEAFGLSDEP